MPRHRVVTRKLPAVPRRLWISPKDFVFAPPGGAFSTSSKINALYTLKGSEYDATPPPPPPLLVEVAGIELADGSKVPRAGDATVEGLSWFFSSEEAKRLQD